MRKFRPFTVADVGDSLQVRVDPFCEDHSYKSAYADNPELVKAFDNMVDAHDLWGWCVVRVRVAYTSSNLHADIFLGECSYEDEEDFTKTSGYYDQMVEEAVQNLNNDIETLLQKLPYYDD